MKNPRFPYKGNTKLSNRNVNMLAIRILKLDSDLKLDLKLDSDVRFGRGLFYCHFFFLLPH